MRWPRRIAFACVAAVVAACGGGGGSGDPVVPAPPPATAPSVALFAGSLEPVEGHRDGPAASALFRAPAGVAVAADGTVYVADTGNHVIRRIAVDGTVETFAGAAGEAGAVDGPRGTARFSSPAGLALDAAGNLYVADAGNATVRVVSATGEVRVLAGSPGQPGDANGTGSQARFRGPDEVARAPDGTLYVADNGNLQVRRIAPDGSVGRFWVPTARMAPFCARLSVSASGTAIHVACSHFSTRQSALLALDGAGLPLPGWADEGVIVPRVRGLASAPDGSLVVASGDEVFMPPLDAFPLGSIHRLAADGRLLASAGDDGRTGRADGPAGAARFRSPAAVALAADGRILVADRGNHAIRVLDAMLATTTLAGGGSRGLVDGPLVAARFDGTAGLATGADGALYVVDRGNRLVRRVADGQVRTFTEVRADGLRSIGALADGGLLVAFYHATRFVSAGQVRIDRHGTVGPAATLKPEPFVVWDAAGRRYEQVLGLQRVAPDGTSEKISSSSAAPVAVDATGRVLAVRAHALVRIDGEGRESPLAGREGEAGARDGLGAEARFDFGLSGANLRAAALDARGNLYLQDASGAIRRITPEGDVSTVAGAVGVVEGLAWAAGFLHASVGDAVLRIGPLP